MKMLHQKNHEKGMKRNYKAIYILHLHRGKFGESDGIDAFRNISMEELSSNVKFHKCEMLTRCHGFIFDWQVDKV